MSSDVLPWPTQTVHYGGVTATVERQTIGHIVALNRILAALPDDGDDVASMNRWRFAKLASQTTAVDGLDVPFPELSAPPEAWQAAYQWFERLDGGLFSAWWQALQDVDAAPSGVDLPSHKLTEAERKNLIRAGSPTRSRSGAGSSSTSTGASEATSPAP